MIKHLIKNSMILCLFITAETLQNIRPAHVPPAPEIAAEAHILIDFNSGAILAEHNSLEKKPVASLTKLMTMYVIAEDLKNGRLKPEETAKVSHKAANAPGSNMYFKQGTKISILDLLKSIIIQSGNDAAITAAEHIAGSEKAFAAIMNQYAVKIGMNNTHFTNPTGLNDQDNYSTAKDLSLLVQTIIRDHPDLYKIYAQKNFKYQNQIHKNRNKLLEYQHCDGVKTGYTEISGFCLAGSSVKNGMRLISVILGCKDDAERFAASHQLLSYGHRFFTTYHIFEPNQIIGQKKIFQAKEQLTDIRVRENLYLTIPTNSFKKLTGKINTLKFIQAPVAENTQIGHCTIELDNKILAKIPIYCDPISETTSKIAKHKENINLILGY